jgi:hypothetical protein
VTIIGWVKNTYDIKVDKIGMFGVAEWSFESVNTNDNHTSVYSKPIRMPTPPPIHPKKSDISVSPQSFIDELRTKQINGEIKLKHVIPVEKKFLVRIEKEVPQKNEFLFNLETIVEEIEMPSIGDQLYETSIANTENQSWEAENMMVDNGKPWEQQSGMTISSFDKWNMPNEFSDVVIEMSDPTDEWQDDDKWYINPLYSDTYIVTSLGACSCAFRGSSDKACLHAELCETAKSGDSMSDLILESVPKMKALPFEDYVDDNKY